MNAKPYLSYSALTNTAYIVVGKEKYPVPQSELKALWELIEKGKKNNG
jgi:hypothetical protein